MARVNNSWQALGFLDRFEPAHDAAKSTTIDVVGSACHGNSACEQHGDSHEDKGVRDGVKHHTVGKHPLVRLRTELKWLFTNEGVGRAGASLPG